MKDALTGRFGAHHALLVGTILSHLEFLDEAIAHLSAEIEEVIAPFAAEVELLTTWLRTALIESARAASRSKGTYLSAQYHRLRGRRGTSRAVAPVGHSILGLLPHPRSCPAVLRPGCELLHNRHDPQRHANKLVRQLRALGYDVTLQPVEAAKRSEAFSPQGTLHPAVCVPPPPGAHHGRFAYAPH